MIKKQVIAAVVLFLSAIGVMLFGQPGLAEKWEHIAKKYQPLLDSREVFIHPLELLEMQHEHASQLVMLDVRKESDYNIFHLDDSVRMEIPQLQSFTWATLPDYAIIVVMSNDEKGAIEAWKYLKVLHVSNVYILEGGINGWIEFFCTDPSRRVYVEHRVQGDDELAYRFDVALGHRFTASRPDPHNYKSIEYVHKVKKLKQARKSGGCG